MKFSIKDFFSKCDQILSFLRIWSHLLKKSSMENFIFCAVSTESTSFFYSYLVIWCMGKVLKPEFDEGVRNENSSVGVFYKMHRQFFFFELLIKK